ncbi:MAG: DUF2304 family protein [Candidatus Undinarchaeales archaeon]|nr:DUF2304 family protein [Candidatus Undinarchaeales archaeon]
MELKVLGIQLIGIAISLLMVFETRVLYKRGHFKRKDLLIWSSVSLGIFIVALFPIAFANFLNIFTNISRGIDALVVLGLLGAYAMVFHVYIRNQESQRQITDLVRKVALKFEETEKKKKKSKK